MKTLEQVINGHVSKTIDGRDLYRFMQFVPEERLSEIRITLKPEYVGTHKEIPFTKENVLKQLKQDVAFGFEKALNKRGISSELMWEVVSMWNWILEEGLEDFREYAQYGLPLFKATAVKYGFDNPIGDHNGNERQYSAESEAW